MLCLRIFDRKWRRKMAYNNMAVNQEKVITSRPWAYYIMLFFFFLCTFKVGGSVCACLVWTLWQLPHYVLEIWKSILAYRPHQSFTRTELFENTLQSGGFWKRRPFIFVWTKNHEISLLPHPRKKKKTIIVTLFSSFGAVCMENIWLVFKLKPPFWNYSGVVGTGASNQDRNHWQAFLFGNVCYCYTIAKHQHQQQRQVKQRQVKQIQNVGFTRLVAFGMV